MVDKIKDVTHNSLHLVLDTICTVDSQKMDVGVMGPGPGKVIVIQPPQQEAAELRSDVTIQRTLRVLTHQCISVV